MSRKSRKRSASNSAARPEPPLLFIDRCAWSRKLGEALQAAGIAYAAHHDHFPDDCPDEDWLKTVGDRGWIVLTRDQWIRRKPNELQAFRDHKVIAFVLTGGNASASNTADLVVKLHAKIIAKAKAATPPAMYVMTMAGAIRAVF